MISTAKPWFIRAGAVLLGAVSVGAFASPASAATLSVCASGCDYTTIKAAVTAAGAGDTINVASETFTEVGPISITRPVTIQGAGQGSTIVDGGGANKAIFDIRPGVSAAGEVAIRGMTIRNGGGSYLIYVGVKRATTDITAVRFDHLTLAAGGASYGLYADGGYTAGVDRVAPTFSFTDSTISGQTYNGLGLDAYRGDASILRNDLREGTAGNSALLVFNEYSPNRILNPVTIRDNTSVGRLVYVRNIDLNATLESRGGFDSLDISNNTITGLTGSDAGILVSTNSATDTTETRMGTVTIEGNTMRGNSDAGTRGVEIGGHVEDTTISGNDLALLGDAVKASVVKGQNPDAITVTGNRLFADTDGVDNSTSSDIDAERNWWGCQTDPLLGGTYCSDANNTGTGSIDTAPWVVTTGALGSSTVEAGGTTSVSVALNQLSDSSAYTFPATFAGFPTTFAADAGSVDPAGGTLSAAGDDSSTYSAPDAAGDDVVTVTVDREGDTTGEPVQLPLTIQDTGVDPGPGDDGDGDSGTGNDGDGAAVEDANAQLPDTGSPVGPWQLAAALGCLALGTAVVISSATGGSKGSRHRA